MRLLKRNGEVIQSTRRIQRTMRQYLNKNTELTKTNLGGNNYKQGKSNCWLLTEYVAYFQSCLPGKFGCLYLG
jgi:hypothetical protein